MPTPKQIADHLGISRPRVYQLKEQGMPVNSLKAAKLWRDKQELKREATNSKTAKLQSRSKGRPMAIVRPAKTGDSLQDALQDSIAAAHTAFLAYQHAATQELTTTSARLSEFNKANQNRLQAERAYREELERRNLLVLRSDITDRCRKCLDTVVRRIKKLPDEQGPQCNEQDPLKARKILQRAVDEILTAASRALHDL